MIDGVSRPLYDGWSQNMELENFLVKHGMSEISSSSAINILDNFTSGEERHEITRN